MLVTAVSSPRLPLLFSRAGRSVFVAWDTGATLSNNRTLLLRTSSASAFETSFLTDPATSFSGDRDSDLGSSPGLNLARLAFVGDWNEARRGAVCRPGTASSTLDASIGTECVGEVLRRFGGDESMVKRLHGDLLPKIGCSKLVVASRLKVAIKNSNIRIAATCA